MNSPLELKILLWVHLRLCKGMFECLYVITVLDFLTGEVTGINTWFLSVHSPSSSLSPDQLHPPSISPQSTAPTSPLLPNLMTSPNSMMTSPNSMMTSPAPHVTSPQSLLTSSEAMMVSSPLVINHSSPVLNMASPNLESNPISCPFPARETADSLLTGRIWKLVYW